MPSYKAPVKDMKFVIHDMWGLEENLTGIDRFADFTIDVVDATLEEAAKLNETLLAPLNQSGDQQGCCFKDGVVTTPEGFKQAYQTYCEAGWSSVTGDPDFGGQGCPEMLNALLLEMQSSSNVSFSLYPGLTQGVCHAINTHASEALKARFLPNMVAGTWTGVMCLTESHAGTDLGLLRTKAVPSEVEGEYKISGTKIFITAGEHDLAENIVHLVLARLPDAPQGVKGISLFLVPKFLVDEQGTLGERNAVSCGAIEHKMGIKASATCVMNYDGAVGYLVGEAHKGLNAMFTVMNTERLAIGLQGLGLGEIAYQNAVQYAKERLQGRAPSGALYPNQPADPLLVHPDIRRMLLTIRAYNEGARALAVWVARQIDYASHHPEPITRKEAAAMVALFTPVVKAFITDYGFEACNLALQVFGGHGYVQEWGMEQFVRDARIAQIYEGANGIQALDLVRRKVLGDKAQTLNQFIEEVNACIAACNKNEGFDFYCKHVTQAIVTLEKARDYILLHADADPALAGASSTPFLRLFALVALSYMWLKAAAVVSESASPDRDFLEAKGQTAAFYMTQLLPQIDSLLKFITAGSGALMAMPTAAF